MVDQKRIQNRIVISIILGVTLVFITASLSIHKQQVAVNRVFMTREVMQEEMELKNKLTALAEIHIVESENNNFRKYISSDLDKASQDYKRQSEEIIKNINYYKERSVYIDAVSILNLDGEIIESTNKKNIGRKIEEEFSYTLEECIRNKYSYEFDLEANQFFIVSPIISETTRECLGYYKKDFNISYLKKVLRKHKVTGKESSFLILKDGTIICDREGVMNHSEKIRETDKYNKLNSTIDNVFVTYINNKGEVIEAVSNYIEGLKMNIVFNLDKADFNGYTRKSIFIIFSICLIIAILVISFIRKIFKIIASDLKAIKKMIKEYERNGYINDEKRDLSLMGREVYKIISEFENERDAYKYNLESINQLFIERDVLTDKIVINKKLWIDYFGFCPEITYKNIINMFLNNVKEIEKGIYTKRVKEARKQKKEFLITEFRLKDKTGNYRWVRENKVFIRNKGGELVKEISNIKDIDLEKKTKLLMKHKSEIDGLTNFYNKEFTRKYIEEYIEGGALGGIFILFDLDNFKYINDNLGHQFGDEVLRQVSENVKGVFRESDIFGRIGGDEFVVFLKGNKIKKYLDEKCEKLVKVLHSEIKKDNITYGISGSVGVAKYPEDSTSYEELYEKADTAMYFAKECGKNSFALYNNKIKTKAQREVEILNLIENLCLNYKNNVEKYIRCSKVRNRITQRVSSYIFFFSDYSFNEEIYKIKDLSMIVQKYHLEEKVYKLIIEEVLRMIENIQVNLNSIECLEIMFLFKELDSKKFMETLTRYTNKYNLDTNKVTIFLNLDYINAIEEKGEELKEKIKKLGYRVGVIHISDYELSYVNLNYVDELIKVSDKMYDLLQDKQSQLLLKHLISFYKEANTRLRLASLSYKESLDIMDLDFNYYDINEVLTYNEFLKYNKKNIESKM